MIDYTMEVKRGHRTSSNMVYKMAFFATLFSTAFAGSTTYTPVTSQTSTPGSTIPVQQSSVTVTDSTTSVDHSRWTRQPSTTAVEQSQQQSTDSCQVKLNAYNGQSNTQPNIEKSNIALLLLVGFGGFSLLIAQGYRLLRKYVFRDEHNLDTVFDAGGRVSTSLTAVTVTSQILWPSDFLMSTTFTSKSGLGGSLWIYIGIFVVILMFPVLSLYLKIRAPGAKTYPQRGFIQIYNEVRSWYSQTYLKRPILRKARMTLKQVDSSKQVIAYARFGKAVHMLFCILGLVTNLIVSTSVMLSGRTTLSALCKDTNNEFIFLLMAVLFGSYCLIGGLGTTFYISYFNTALTFLSVSVYILYTSFYPSPDIEDITLIDKMYDKVQCLKGPDGNYDNSYLTFKTRSGIIFGFVLFVTANSIGFCDQANWQSRIATKPAQGVIAYILAAYLWFVLPTSLSLTATMSYLSMSAVNGTHLLSDIEIDSGYITPFIMNVLLGDTGSYLLLTMIMMAIMSTGSGEVMAISSIIVYDIYKTHINPFRKNLTPTSCVLCGKEKKIDIKDEPELEYCVCPSAIDCEACKVDIATRSSNEKSFGIHYKCDVHGQYRHYEDGLLRYKTWCMICLVVAIVPYGLLISETSLNIYWATLGMTPFTGPFLIPLFLTLTWSKTTARGIISGCVIGLVCSITAMLIGGSMYEEGLGNFFVNTVQDFPLIASLLSGFISSGVITVGVSLCTHTIRTEDDEAREWAKTINIDNPLNPFRLVYKEELEEIQAGKFITANKMDRIFRKTKILAIVGGGISMVLMSIVIPSIVLSIDTVSKDQFHALIRTFQYLCFGATVIVVFLPPIEEWIHIRRQLKRNREESSNT